jgi:hypothetical protein
MNMNPTSTWEGDPADSRASFCLPLLPAGAWCNLLLAGHAVGDGGRVLVFDQILLQSVTVIQLVSFC